MNLVITVRYKRQWWRGLREWWYELLHGCNQLVFSDHPGTYQMGSDHEGIFTNHQARKQSEEIEITVFSSERKHTDYPNKEVVELLRRISALAKGWDYDLISTRYRHPN